MQLQFALRFPPKPHALRLSASAHVLVRCAALDYALSCASRNVSRLSATRAMISPASFCWSSPCCVRRSYT